ncbi:MAG: PIN domain-containing protein [Mycobacteriales bacterium]
MAIATLVADKSAYARLHVPVVFAQLAPLIERGLVATCSMIDLEILYSSRSPAEYDGVLSERAGLERLDMSQADWDRAMQVQRRLAALSQHRAASIPDLLIAAVAERHRVTVVHYDHDFDQIAEVTGQDTRWVVPAGSVP